MKREFKHPQINHTFIIEDPVFNNDGFPIPNTIKIDGIIVSRQDLEYAFNNMYGLYNGISDYNKSLWACERIYEMKAEEFIKIIESIGFKEVTKNTRYKYKNWKIGIMCDSFKKICWSLTYSDGNPDPLNKVEVTHTFIPINEYKILQKYFKSELREVKLNEIL
jgi:hypothetical protein